MKLLIDENVIAVLKIYPSAYRCEDLYGYYIVDGSEVGKRPVIAAGRTAKNAWKHAALLLKRKAKKHQA